MSIVRLEPSSSVAAEFIGLSVVGAATAHEALSDASDGSYVQLAVSSTEPTKWYRGGLTDLPDGIGVINGTTINVRAAFSTGAGRLGAGEYPNARLTNTLTGTITDYAGGPFDLGTVVFVNTLMEYMAGVNWVSGTGNNLRIYKMNFDVDCDFVNGVVVAMIFGWLGPLVAVGLYEMPALAAELWRRSRTLILPHELHGAWRELREHRARRYFLPV